MTRSRANPRTAPLVLAALLAVPGFAAGVRAADAPAASAKAVPVSIDSLIRESASYPAVEPADLWRDIDPGVQAQVEAAIGRLGLSREVREGDLSIVFVEASDLDHPRVADLNGDEMMYAASLPKIAVLLASFDRIEHGQMKLDPPTYDLMVQMIRRSSNEAASELMQRVGKENIARILVSQRYRLYDPRHGGGLWVGKDYARAGLWRRDPLHNLSHGATAMQVARFYYLLETGQLVSHEASRKMKEILSDSALEHKFVKELHQVNPNARLFRKSGSWRTFHSDSVLVTRDNRRYIAVALANDPDARSWLVEIIGELDEIVFPGDS